MKENRRPIALNKTPSRLQTDRLQRVHSPSTSQSPFRSITNVKSPQHTYFRRQEDMLDETINKLGFLEQKIAYIMQKNDQLRSHLKKTESDSIDSFSYYLSGPTKKSSCFSQQSYVPKKLTIHTTIDSSREQKRQSAKSPSISKFKKSNITVNEENYNGRGKKHYENGISYEGDWVNGIREGNGTLKHYNNIVYQGQWQNDQFNGRGKFVNQDYTEDNLQLHNFKQFRLVQHQFTQYEGEFRDGQFHGQGVMTFNCSHQEYKFVGAFAQDQFHGVGTLSHNDEVILQGKWIYGCFV